MILQSYKFPVVAAVLSIALYACDSYRGNELTSSSSTLISPNVAAKARESILTATSPVPILCFEDIHSDINFPDEELYRSAKKGDFESLKNLIKNDIGIASSNETCRIFHNNLVCRLPPIYLAVESGNAEAVKVLLAAGADPNPTNSREAVERLGFQQNPSGALKAHICIKNTTPLLKAVERGVVDSVGLLLEAGAKHNVRDDRNFSPLRWAIVRKKFKIIKQLLEYDVDPMFADSNGMTDLEFARRLSDKKAFEILQSHCRRSGGC